MTNTSSMVRRIVLALVIATTVGAQRGGGDSAGKSSAIVLPIVPNIQTP
jgi:hypothetical protein